MRWVLLLFLSVTANAQVTRLVTNAGPASYVTFEDGAARSLANPATLTGTPVFYQAISGKGGAFTGGVQYVDCGSITQMWSGTVTSSFSIAMWNRSGQTWIGADRSSSTVSAGYFYIDAARVPNWFILTRGDSPFGYVLTSSLTGTLNRLCYFGMSVTVPPMANTSTTTFNVTFCVNGVTEVKSFSPYRNSVTVADFKNWSIARHVDQPNATSYKLGTNDEVQIFSRALSAEELKSLYFKRRTLAGLCD